MGEIKITDDIAEWLKRLETTAPGWRFRNSLDKVTTTAKWIVESGYGSRQTGFWILIENKEEAMAARLAFDFKSFGEAEYDPGKSSQSYSFNGYRQPQLSSGWYYKE